MKPFIAASCLLATSLSASAALPGADALAKLITSQFDTNADQLIDAGEWQGGNASSFDKLDANGDGSLTGEEIDGLQEEIGKETGDLASGLVTAIIKQIILSLDKNGDKVVSRNEFSDDGNTFFAKLDADKNGILTQTELTALPTALIGK